MKVFMRRSVPHINLHCVIALALARILAPTDIPVITMMSNQDHVLDHVIALRLEVLTRLAMTRITTVHLDMSIRDPSPLPPNILTS